MLLPAVTRNFGKEVCETFLKMGQVGMRSLNNVLEINP